MPPRAEELSVEWVRSMLRYDPLSGSLFWAAWPGGSIKIGAKAGCAHRTGYLVVKLRQRMYLVHRVIWAIVQGEWPAQLIDHRDGDKSNNKWANLRSATSSTNGQNKRHATARNKTGLLGVRKNKNGRRFIANIWVGGKSRCLGVFDSAEAAHEAYVAAKRKLHEGCTI